MSARASTPPLRAADSAISGTGVFAQRAFDPDQRIRRIEGSLHSLEEVLRFAESGEQAGSDVLGVDDGAYLVLSELDRCFNHSCDPNAVVMGAGDRVEFVAIRSIRPGDEITFDYSTTMHDDEDAIVAAGRTVWRCECSCGAANCRGQIDQFRTLAPEVRTRYLENGWAPDFIVRAFS